jgi:hypothetical protein
VTLFPHRNLHVALWRFALHLELGRVFRMITFIAVNADDNPRPLAVDRFDKGEVQAWVGFIDQERRVIRTFRGLVREEFGRLMYAGDQSAAKVLRFGRGPLVSRNPINCSCVSPVDWVSVDIQSPLQELSKIR